MKTYYDLWGSDENDASIALLTIPSDTEQLDPGDEGSDGIRFWDDAIETITGQGLDVWVMPQRPTECVCSRCFLLVDRSLLVDESSAGEAVCVDCAGTDTATPRRTSRTRAQNMAKSTTEEGQGEEARE
ncbi:hypothetical protein GCM10028798_28820 [Humibacter antri]